MQLYYRRYREKMGSRIPSFIRVNFCRQASSALAKCIQAYGLLSKHNFLIFFLIVNMAFNEIQEGVDTWLVWV